MSHHQVQAFEIGRASGNGFQGIITGIYEGRTEKQILGGVTTDRELGRQQQVRALRVGLPGGINDLAGIALHVPHHKIELGHTDFERHETVQPHEKKRSSGVG